MNVLVINCGSSSLKFQLINSETEDVLAKGLCERIGIGGSRIVYKPTGKEKQVIESPMPNHTNAVSLVLECLTHETYGVIKSLDEIGAVGHRAVHGGEKFSKAVLITKEVRKIMEGTIELAPLHVPANLIGIDVCSQLMPETPMVAVFDTAFHQTMPQKAFLYGVPYKYYTDYQIRRYGFHGTSHSYVSKRTAEILGVPKENLKTIVCHLGNGASVCAVDGGKSVDTSMGFTPITGLVMGTRCGDIDPEIIEYVAAKEGTTAHSVMEVLNKKSGIYGLTDGIVDFRDLRAGCDRGDEACLRAMEIFVYNVATRVGAYAAAMNGVDAIAFTAGIGENAPTVRKAVCEYLGYLGVKIDDAANDAGEDDSIITTPDSKTKVLVVPTNEELMIARETVEVVKSL
ncbi:MAG: acetate kinase [Clostridiales bacterium]|nr:acetate kinase [Clostridiales bacterium]MDY3746481.1 acetate kinase [Lachnospiraceae bacterium]